MQEAEFEEHNDPRDAGDSASHRFHGPGTPSSPAVSSGGLIDVTGAQAVEIAKGQGGDFYFSVEDHLFRATPDGRIEEPDRMRREILIDGRRLEIFNLLKEGAANQA